VHQGVDLGLGLAAALVPRRSQVSAPALMEVDDVADASASGASATAGEGAAPDAAGEVVQARGPDTPPATFFGAVTKMLRSVFSRHA